MTKEFSFIFLADTLHEIKKEFKFGSNITFTLKCTNFKYTYIPNSKKKVVYIPFVVKEVPIILDLG